MQDSAQGNFQRSQSRITENFIKITNRENAKILLKCVFLIFDQFRKMETPLKTADLQGFLSKKKMVVFSKTAILKKFFHFSILGNTKNFLNCVLEHKHQCYQRLPTSLLNVCHFVAERPARF